MTDSLEAIFARMHIQVAENEKNEALKNAPKNYAADAAQCGCQGKKPGYWLDETKNPSTYVVCSLCDPSINCKACNGFGMRFIFDLTTLIDCVVPGACDCRKVGKKVTDINRSNIPERFIKSEIAPNSHSNNLPSSLAEVEQDGLYKLHAAARQFCENVMRDLQEKKSTKKPFLVLFGGVGTGKTYLSCAILKHLIFKYACSGVFCDFQQLLGTLRDSIGKDISETAILNRYINAQVLVIDDLGKIRPDKDWQIEKLDDLINARYNANKLTILTTNFAPVNYKFDYTKSIIDSQDAVANNADSHGRDDLKKRIGDRMYDRILEVSQFLDFAKLPSIRANEAEEFLNTFR